MEVPSLGTEVVGGVVEDISQPSLTPRSRVGLIGRQTSYLPRSVMPESGPAWPLHIINEVLSSYQASMNNMSRFLSWEPFVNTTAPR